MTETNRRPSIKHISAYSVVAGIAVLAIAAGIMLQRFLTLDAYRPIILAQLQAATGRKVTIGSVRARFVPPSVSAENIVMFELSPPHRPVVSAERVRLGLKLRPLFEGKLQIHTAAFERTRLILYSDRLEGARAFQTPSSESAGPPQTIRVLIHQGKIELRGPLFGQTIRWAIDNVEAEITGAQRRISLSARPSFLGPSARLKAIVDLGAKKPILAELKQANLDSLFSILGSTQATVWRGATLDARGDASWPITRRIHLRVERLSVPSIPHTRLRGDFNISTATIQGRVQFDGLASSMTVEGQWSARRGGWNADANVQQYSPEIVRFFLDNYWAHALEDPGSLVIKASQKGTRPPQFSISGSSFTFAGSRFSIPALSATYDGAVLGVRVDARTSDGDGRANVHWSQNLTTGPGTITVDALSIRAGDVLDVFAVRPSTPIGIELWRINKGHFAGALHSNGIFDVQEAALNLQNLIVATTGQIDFSTAPAQAHFVGRVSEVQLLPVLENLGARPAPISGTAHAKFNIHFAGDSDWLSTLSGRVEAQSQDGFINAGKVIYKIAGFLNLTGLLKPSVRTKTSATGFPYTSTSASARLVNGTLDCKDLKIRTDNMNIGGGGRINLPGNTIDAKVELQLMNVVKDTLSAIPLMKRIVTPDTGLIRVPVRVRGKLDNPEID